MNGIGIDTGSVEGGNNNQTNLIHRRFSDANLYMIESVANLDRLTPTGYHLTILPIKVRDATGGPTRIIATKNKRHNCHH